MDALPIELMKARERGDLELVEEIKEHLIIDN